MKKAFAWFKNQWATLSRSIYVGNRRKKNLLALVDPFIELIEDGTLDATKKEGL